MVHEELTQTLQHGARFYEKGDRDPLHPLVIVAGELQVRKAFDDKGEQKHGGPTHALGWETVSRALVMRIGIGRRFTFPPVEEQSAIIFASRQAFRKRAK